MQYKPTFGSISHGTMRPEDLIPTFADELRRCANGHPGNLTLANEADAIEDYDSNEAQEILDDLFSILSEYAPEYGYFGSHPGDGSDYGFWLHEDWQQMARDDDVLEVSDTSEIPEGYTGSALHVNDHGNATLYTVTNGKAREVWSVV